MNIMKRSLSVLLTLCMLVGMLVPSAFAADTRAAGTNTATGTTSGNPFVKGTAGSNSFRIPALVTLSDGTMVAAADARWNSPYDGGGNDTLVARSTDDGATWSWSFANYFGDNGDTYNADSTCFIDPALAVDENDNIYMLVDLYPYGVALNGEGNTQPVTTKGFNSEGKLLLAEKDSTNYNYYLDNGRIYSADDGSAVSGYTVDEYFNITGNGTSSNLFFKDSPYKVVRTGYLYLTKSTDKGETWSAPKLLDLKTSSEMVCLAAPGRGLVTENGTVVFPVYSYNGPTESQKMSFISSADGENWTRSGSFTGATWSSESAVVELSDGTLRFFYRNGTSRLCYVDFKDNAWGSAVNTGIATNSNTQISAIKYSRPYEGKEAIFVSCPTGKNSNGSSRSAASERLNGKIFAFTVGDNNALEKVGEVAVTTNDAQFMYSCLTERTDGAISILYENGESAWEVDGYYTMDFKTYGTDDFGLKFDLTNNAPVSPDNSNGENSENNETGDTPLALPENFTTAAATGSAVQWTLVENGASGIVSGKEYVIASGKEDGTVYLLKNDGSAVKSEVTGVGNNVRIEKAIDDSCVFTITESGSSYTIKGSDNKYLYPYYNSSWNCGIKSSSDAQNITIDGTSSVKISYSGDLSSSTAYITYNNNFSASRYSVFASPLYLFTKTNAFTISLENFNALINSVPTAQGNYTDATWSRFETALNAAKALQSIPLTYNTEAEAASAVEELNTAAQELYDAWQKLETVKTVNITINYVSGGKTVKTETKSVVENASSVEIGKKITDGINNYSINDSQVTDGKLTLTNGTTTYRVNVTLIEGTEITIKEHETKELTVDLADGQRVEWTTADASHVGVAGKYDAAAKKYTNTGVIAGYKVTDTDAPVLVTGTVYNEDGSVASVNKWLVTVVEGDADTNTSSCYIKIDVKLIENCTVYYSINGGELIKINGTGLLLDKETTGHFNIMFFAAPDEGYALTYMGVTKSGDQYYTLSDGNDDGTGSGAWPFVSASQTTIPKKNNGDWNSESSDWKVDNGSKHGFRWALGEGNMTIDQMKIMFSQAIALGCDGATNFTKNSTDGFETEVRFIAEKLPELHKKLTGITHDGKYSQFTDGMTVSIGDKLHYTIYVSVPKMEYSQSGEITYSDFIVSDDKTGATWTASSIGSETAASRFYFGSTSKNVTSTTLTNYANNIKTAARANGSIDRFTSDSFSYTNAAGESVTYNASTSNLYAFHTDIEVTNDNFNTIVDKDGDIINTASLKYTYKSNYSSGSYSAESKAVVEVKLTAPEYVIDFGLPVSIPMGENGILDGTIESATANYGTVTKTENGLVYTPNKILPATDFITIKYTNGRNYGVRIYPATSVFYEESFITTAGTWAHVGTETKTAQMTEKLGEHKNVYGFDPVYAANTDSSYITTQNGGSAIFTFKGTGFKLYANSDANTGCVTVYSKGNISKLYMIDTHLEGGTTGATSGQNTDEMYYGLPIISETDLPYGEYVVQLRQTGTKPLNISGIEILGALEDTTVYTSDLEDNPEFHEMRDHVLHAMNVENVNTSDYISTNNRDGLVSKVEDLAGQVYNAAEGANSAIVIDSGNVLTAGTAQDLLDNGPKNELYLYADQTLTFKVKTARVMQLGMKSPVNGATFTVTVNGKAIDTKNIKTSVEMFYALNAKPDKETEYTVTVSVTAGMLSVTDLKICDDPNAQFTELTSEDIENALYIAYGVEDFVNAASAKVTVKYVNIFGRELGRTALTKYFTDEKFITIGASEIRSGAPAGKRALKILPLIVRPDDDVTIVVPVF